ncbi:MAG: 50S ribosomal protein L22 [Candidatus Goldiibacteriota bacterium]
MEARATGKHLRVTPNKVRLVVKEIRRTAVNDALIKLQFINKAAAPVVEKVLKSAVANASKNHGADADKLFIKDVIVDQGPILKWAKRFQARAQGRAAPIQKKSTHITVVVSDEKLKTKKK